MSGDMNRRPYWSERAGHRLKPGLSPKQVRSLFASLVAELETRGCLQESFGYECVDEGAVPGTLGPAVNERLLLLLGWDNVWPITASKVAAWSDDELFDVIEFLHDHVSEGDENAGRFHSFANCGWHYYAFNTEPAQFDYRIRVNEILEHLGDGFQLNDSGEIMSLAPEGLEPLLDASLPGVSNDDVDHVAAAIHKFRSRASTPTQRRDAVRDLADVLEGMRRQVREQMFS